MTSGRIQKIECEVTFLSKSEHGWGRSTLPALNGNSYRPHLVIGDPNQRHAIVTGRMMPITNADGTTDERWTDKFIDEEYLGVMFELGPTAPNFEVSLNVTLILLFFPHPSYEKLQPDITFTIREGGTVVGYGKVLRWLLAT